MNIRLNKNNIPVATSGRAQQKMTLYLKDWESFYSNADKEVSPTEYSLRLYIEDVDIANTALQALAGWKWVRKGHFYYLLLTSPRVATKKNKELVLELGRPRFTDTEEPNKFGKVRYRLNDNTLKTKEFNLQITKKKRKMYPLTPNVHGNIITGKNYKNGLKVYLLNTGAEDLKFTKSSRLKISYYTDASDDGTIAKPDAVATGRMAKLRFDIKTSTGTEFKKPRGLMGAAPKVDCFTSNFAPAKNVDLKPNQFILIEIGNFVTTISPRTGLLYAEVTGLDNEDSFRLPVPITIASPDVQIIGQLSVDKKITAKAELEVSQQLVAKGDIQAKRKLEVEVIEGCLTKLLPIGTIVMWNKSSIPTGWAICDGKNGTPDLTNRFVVGVGNGTLPQYSYKKAELGSTGGSEKVWLYPKHIPEHIGYPKTYSGIGNSDNCDIINIKRGPDEDRWGKTPIDNRPPFYAMFYIMRIK